MSKKLILFLVVYVCHSSYAQTALEGFVYEIANKKEVSVPGVTIHLLPDGTSTFTDSVGHFRMHTMDANDALLVVSFPGFITDTIKPQAGKSNLIILKKSIDLSEVKITANKEATVVSTLNPINMEKLTSDELLKAACCNLSEAFETNPSVNVAYKDAVTGVKEIQLLGLGGTYVQMQSENIPDMHGLSGIYGLTYVPGPWIESIQLTKGSGSVLNGYESTTGQINIEYKKPFDTEQPRFFLNLFGDEFGSLEANVLLKKKVSQHWSSMLMIHGKNMGTETDRNHDGFMDAPGNKTINLYNRWSYHDAKKLEAQLGIKFLADELLGGQLSNLNVTDRYRTSVITRRAEISGKLGFIFPDKPHKSIGNIVQLSIHDMQSSFGLKHYDAKESSLYLQSIYQNVLWHTNHKYKTGVTFRYNLLEQGYAGLPLRTEDYIPGIFFEYTYNYFDKLTIVAGVREDIEHDNTWLFTPRLHGKYNFTENNIVRFSAGKSYRRPYLIADHLSVLASSRQTVVREFILPERAWNYGVNFTTRFTLHGHEFTFAADAYRTNFINQLVVDSYTDSTAISFYNLNGKSFSNSLQVTVNSELSENLNIRLAYKIDDVQSTFNGKLEQVPLAARDRALLNVSGKSGNAHWKFDYTAIWEGKKKLQNVYHDEAIQTRQYSPSFVVMNLQVTKVFRRFEVYAGAENIADYRQEEVIINPENPFGNSFDATNIWGPVQGRRIYAGLRYSIR